MFDAPRRQHPAVCCPKTASPKPVRLTSAHPRDRALSLDLIRDLRDAEILRIAAKRRWLRTHC
jgi:hypothetical protein